MLGSFQNGPVKDVLSWQGDISGFMFSVNPNLEFFTPSSGDGASYYYYINSVGESIVSEKRKGFGFGGD